MYAIQLFLLVLLSAFSDAEASHTPPRTKALCKYLSLNNNTRRHLLQIDSLYYASLSRVASDKDFQKIISYYQDKCFVQSKKESFYLGFGSTATKNITTKLKRTYSKRPTARSRMLVIEYDDCVAALASSNALTKVYSDCKQNESRGEKCREYYGYFPARIDNFVILIFQAEESPLLRSSVISLKKDMFQSIVFMSVSKR